MQEVWATVPRHSIIWKPLSTRATTCDQLPLYCCSKNEKKIQLHEILIEKWCRGNIINHTKKNFTWWIKEHKRGIDFVSLFDTFWPNGQRQALEEAKRNQSLRLPKYLQTNKTKKLTKIWTSFNLLYYTFKWRYKKSFSKFSIAGSEWGANIIDISFNNVLFPHVYYCIFAHHLCV